MMHWYCKTTYNLKQIFFPTYNLGRREDKLGLNMFLVPINIPTFRFSPSKIFIQLLVSIKNFIFTFGPSFKVNSYVEFIFLNKILQKNL